MKSTTAAAAIRELPQWGRVLAGAAAILFGVALAQLSDPGFSARPGSHHASQAAQSYPTHSFMEFQR